MDSTCPGWGEQARSYSAVRLGTGEVEVMDLMPARSPDLNTDEAIRAWVRAGATANTCPGTAANVQAQVAHFLDGLKGRTAEVQSRCRTTLRALAEGLAPALPVQALEVHHVEPTCALG